MSVLVERTLDNARQLVASIQNLAQEHDNVQTQLQIVQQQLKEAQIQAHTKEYDQSCRQSVQPSRSSSLLHHIDANHQLSQDELVVGQALVNQIRSINIIPLKIFRIMCAEITNQPLSERDILSNSSISQQTKAINDGRCLEVYAGLLMRAMSFHILDCGRQRGDGGVDVKACLIDHPSSDYNDDNRVYHPSDHVVLQCKQYRDTTVQAGQIRELIGTMVLSRCNTGVMITTDRISEGSYAAARQLASNVDDSSEYAAGSMSLFLWDASKLARYLGMFAADILDFKRRIIETLRNNYRNVVQQVEYEEPSFCVDHCLGQIDASDLCNNPRCQFHPSVPQQTQLPAKFVNTDQATPLKSSNMINSFASASASRHRLVKPDQNAFCDLERSGHGVAMNKPRSPTHQQHPLSVRRVVPTPYRMQQAAQDNTLQNHAGTVTSPQSARLQAMYNEQRRGSISDLSERPFSKSANHSPSSAQADRVSVNLSRMFGTPNPCKPESSTQVIDNQPQNLQIMKSALKHTHRSLPSTPMIKPSNSHSQNESPNVPNIRHQYANQLEHLEVPDVLPSPPSEKHVNLVSNESSIQRNRRIKVDRFLTVSSSNEPKSAGFLTRTSGQSLQVFTARTSSTRPPSPKSGRSDSYASHSISHDHHLHIPANVRHSSQSNTGTGSQSPFVNTSTSQPFSPLSPCISERPPALNPSFVAALIHQHREGTRREEASVAAVRSNNSLDEQVDANYEDVQGTCPNDDDGEEEYRDQEEANDQLEGYSVRSIEDQNYVEDNGQDESDDEIPSFECSSDDENLSPHPAHLQSRSSPSVRRSRTRWTQQEEAALCAGVLKYHDPNNVGRGKKIWSLIRHDPLLGPQLARHVGDSDLKDKYRSLPNVQY